MRTIAAIYIFVLGDLHANEKVSNIYVIKQILNLDIPIPNLLSP